MKIEVVKHPKTDLNEAFINGVKVGVCNWQHFYGAK
jgi:hypothetical protein